MNRVEPFNYIEERLSTLANRVERRGKLNILDLHLHSENLFARLLNQLFGWELINQNTVNQNASSVDLVDSKNEIAVQVSATATRAKIESCLRKTKVTRRGWRFKFLSISKDADNLRKQTYSNESQFLFDPQQDILDITVLLRHVLAEPPNNQDAIAKIIREELGVEVRPEKVNSNLATIIHVLSKEDLSQTDSSGVPPPFSIDDKMQFNQLVAARAIVEDYKVHHSRINRIYREFDRQGSNKSTAILQKVRHEYLVNKGKNNPDELFLLIAQNIMRRIQTSLNYVHIPIEELELCVNILVVDAFIRCKIFENPQGTQNVAL